MPFVKGVARQVSEKGKPGRFEIWVSKTDADPLGYTEGERTHFRLLLGSETYEAGLRATRDNNYVWICPDLTDTKGSKVKLIDALNDVGIQNKDVLLLEPIRLQEGGPPSTILIHFPSANAVEEIDRHRFELNTLTETERNSVIKSRVGQGVFRDGLVQIWGGCSVTGLEDPALLKASHAKPWRDCSNQERLDCHNGLLLIPNLDHLFDSGLITFDPNGGMVISGKLSKESRRVPNVADDMRLRRVREENRFYLTYHRENVFCD